MTAELIALRGAAVEVLVDGVAGGPFTLLRYTAPPAFIGAPPHRHAVTTEAFHVLDGVLTLTLDGDDVRLEAGATAVVGIGRVHGFRNDGSTPTTFLVIAAPPGLEQFLRELAALMADSPTWPPRDPAGLRELSLRFDQIQP